MPEPNEPIVERAARGDPLAVDSLLARHLPGLLAFVRLRAGDKLRSMESTMDLVQSACREVLEDIPQMQQRDDANFRSWLYSAAERKIVDRARYHASLKRGVGRAVGGTPQLQAAEEGLLATAYKGFFTPSENASAREELERFEVAFGKLPSDYRDVIVLARVVGHSIVEVARQMGRSEGAVKMLLHRALAQLALLTS